MAVGAAGGAEKVDAVRAVGADVAVDYVEPAWPERVAEALGERRVSVVLDGVGGELGRAALELLGPGGRILLFGLSSGEPTWVETSDLMRLGITASWALGGGIADRMRELETKALAEAAAGRLVPLVGRRFPLAQAAEAHRAIEARETMGKVVLVPWGASGGARPLGRCRVCQLAVGLGHGPCGPVEAGSPAPVGGRGGRPRAWADERTTETAPARGRVGVPLGTDAVCQLPSRPAQGRHDLGTARS